ncbi:segregation and condensation protein B [Bernardetia litoralis DSM 6794]|uniref:Segregation and condensation protein B n=1 Tax=Bernardetia litoralis (strain ATCC 23117 / DSM 6794 / NBRC 15988 / NCIMB 1366 / Fx l1 / Sio-4) TaxID=880071 RepID=I4AKR1_BERLS|nr:segregation and condensation protein B [Bernardetia litoralis DSM 6794]
MQYLLNHIESLIFCSPSPISVKEIQKVLEELFGTEVPKKDIEDAIEVLQKRYEQADFSIEIKAIAGGFQFLTKPEFQSSISLLLTQRAKRKLSKSAIETLALIAYKQPITKAKLEAIRGVSCDYAVQKLLEKELLVIKGKDKTAGRPILYGTSDKFMHYFGINSLDDLPMPEDLSAEDVETAQKQAKLQSQAEGEEGDEFSLFKFQRGAKAIQDKKNQENEKND